MWREVLTWPRHVRAFPSILSHWLSHSKHTDPLANSRASLEETDREVALKEAQASLRAPGQVKPLKYDLRRITTKTQTVKVRGD